jgi:flavin-dependent dehydrogenase
MDRLVLEFGTVPGGYGWIFPKGSHLNVGVGGWKSEAPNLRAHLARLCEAHGFDRASLTDVRAHHLPFRKRGSSLAVGKIALIGDAAGLADPLSGDGIYEAALSAGFAAEHALRILASSGRRSTPSTASRSSRSRSRRHRSSGSSSRG